MSLLKHHTGLLFTTSDAGKPPTTSPQHSKNLLAAASRFHHSYNNNVHRSSHHGIECDNTTRSSPSLSLQRQRQRQRHLSPRSSIPSSPDCSYSSTNYTHLINITIPFDAPRVQSPPLHIVFRSRRSASHQCQHSYQSSQTSYENAHNKQPGLLLQPQRRRVSPTTSNTPRPPIT
jgi:hypothetical protein